MSDEKVGIVFSAFDLLHAGHVAMLTEAKWHCDYLIIGLQTDPSIDRPEKNKPIQSIFERYLQLKCNKDVDEIVPYESEQDLLDILQTYTIHKRFVGDEYREKGFTGKQFCEDNGIELVYNKRLHSFSTSSLRERIKNAK